MKILAYYIVPAIAFLVAIHQVITVKTSTMDPWKRGGFGMFSVVDRGSSRRFQCVVITTKGRTVPCPPVFSENEIRKILVDPREENLARLTESMLSTVRDQPEKFRHVTITKVSMDIRGISYSVDLNKVQFKTVSSYTWEK